MYEALREAIAQLTSQGQLFEMNEVEVRGQRMRAWANAPGSLRDVWLNSRGYGDADYLVFRDERWSYHLAHEQVARVANWLLASGIGQHDHVAIALRNYPEWMLAYWAVISIGAVPVGINAWWVAEELQYGLKDSGARLLICDRERLERFEQIRDGFPDLRVVTVRMDEVPAWADSWNSLLVTEPKLPEVTIDPDDDACIFYTSGTTGQPKGAQLTHRGCVNNLFSLMFINIAQAMAQAKTGDAPAGENQPAGQAQMAAIVTTPLFHVTSNNCLAQTMTLAGGKLVHMYRWDAGEALRIIEEERITNFSGVPTMAREIISHPDFATRDTSSLTTLGGGGAAVQPDLVDKIGSRGRGAAPAQGYGMTETCGIISASGGSYLSDKPDSAGLVMPIYEVKCIDEAGADLAPGEVGEICVRGAQVIKGYLNRPEATAETIVDGWLRTGDIGYVDEDNFVYLVDRAKDMVVRGGENVYCSEVEIALYKHDDVAECAVFSVPDDRLGEEVGAAIFPVQDRHPTAEEIRSFCRDHLAAYKIPRYLWILQSPLPRNASGKFLKRELRETLHVSDAG
jgi:acyl-CoA synthetase (AMP-forming)/AMP-acid ligase II